MEDNKTDDATQDAAQSINKSADGSKDNSETGQVANSDEESESEDERFVMGVTKTVEANSELVPEDTRSTSRRKCTAGKGAVTDSRTLQLMGAGYDSRHSRQLIGAFAARGNGWPSAARVSLSDVGIRGPYSC